MKIELIADATREHGWWLIVDGSEQSFVDTADPLHVEFEYVQIISEVLEAVFDPGVPLRALHLGGGLLTVPRWVAARHPGSRQRVIEHNREIARLAASLGTPPGVTVVIDDAPTVVTVARRRSNDLVLCDIYEGPETVTSLFTLDAIGQLHSLLRPDGVLIANLSDAAPFALARVVAAAMTEVFETVVLMAEPPVLRGRRSGNVVITAADRALPLQEIRRRAAGSVVRSRVVAEADLADFIGDARPARTAAGVPESGESTGRPLFS